MKNKIRQWLLPAALAFVLLVTLTGCGKREAVTAEAFQSAMEKQGYTVTDLTAQANSSGISKILLAENSEKDINIRLTITESDSIAKQLYKADVDVYEAADPQIKTAADVGNYNNFKASFNGEQVYVVEYRVDNTLISGAGDLSKKEQVDAIYSGFNY